MIDSSSAKLRIERQGHTAMLEQFFTAPGPRNPLADL